MVADANRRAGLVAERKFWNKSTTHTDTGRLVLGRPLGGPSCPGAEWTAISPGQFLLGSGACSTKQVCLLQAWLGASQSHTRKTRPHFSSDCITRGPREAALRWYRIKRAEVWFVFSLAIVKSSTSESAWLHSPGNQM